MTIVQGTEWKISVLVQVQAVDLSQPSAHREQRSSKGWDAMKKDWETLASGGTLTFVREYSLRAMSFFLLGCLCKWLDRSIEISVSEDQAAYAKTMPVRRYP